MRIEPRDVPRLRSELIEQYENKFYVNYLEAWSGEDYLPYLPGTTKSDRVVRDKQAIQDSVLYYASADMAKLAFRAASSLPAYELQEFDLPTPCGVLFWDDSPLKFRDVRKGGEEGDLLPICAASWFAMAGRDIDSKEWVRGVFVSCYTSREAVTKAFSADGTLKPNELKIIRKSFSRVTPAISRYLFVPFDTRIPGMDRMELVGDLSQSEVDAGKAMALIKSTWLMSEQKNLTDRSEVQAPRSVAKQLGRLGHPVDAVRVIDLKKRGTRKGDVDSGRKYVNCRWEVDGHWRQQWYPSLNAHRPVWIESYLKGLDEAPLLTGPKVKVVR